MLGLLGLLIFEATGANVEEISEAYGHRVLRVHGKFDKIVLVPPASGGGARDRPRHPGPRSGTRAAKPHRQIAWTGTVRPGVCVASHGRPASPHSGCILTSCGTPS